MSHSRTPHPDADALSEKRKAESDYSDATDASRGHATESEAQRSAVRRGRVSLSDLSIKRRLPLLTALLLFGVISAATLLSYFGVRGSARRSRRTEIGRAHV